MGLLLVGRGRVGPGGLPIGPAAVTTMASAVATATTVVTRTVVGWRAGWASAARWAAAWRTTSLFGEVDVQRSAVQILAVELIDGGLRLFLAAELHEREPSGASGGAIGRHVHIDDLASRSEMLAQALFGRPIVEIADEDF